MVDATLSTFPVSRMGCDAPIKDLICAELTRVDAGSVIFELLSRVGRVEYSKCKRMTRRDARTCGHRSAYCTRSSIISTLVPVFLLSQILLRQTVSSCF